MNCYKCSLKLWVTVDARVDYDNGRVVQWNDISHGENHLKQNHADKSPKFENSDTEGETIVFGKNTAYVSSQPVQLFEKADSGLNSKAASAQDSVPVDSYLRCAQPWFSFYILTLQV